MPDPKLTLRKGAVAPWAKSTSPYYHQTLEALGKHFKFRLDTPWSELPEAARDAILYGSGDEEVRFAYDDGLRAYEVKKPFEGVVAQSRAPLSGDGERLVARGDPRYMSATPCEACDGSRLKPEALAVKIAGQHIGEVEPALGQGRGRLGRRPAATSSTPSTTRSPSAS